MGDRSTGSDSAGRKYTSNLLDPSRSSRSCLTDCLRLQVAAEDKGKIAELFGAIPEDLEHLKAVNWEHLDYKDVEYMNLGVRKVLRGCGLGE